MLETGKIRELDVGNRIVDDSNSDSNEFGRWLRNKSDSKSTIESMIAISM